MLKNGVRYNRNRYGKNADQATPSVPAMYTQYPCHGIIGPESVPASSRLLDKISGAIFLYLNNGFIMFPVRTWDIGWEQLIRLVI